jgi:hypothetical protein
MQKRLLFIACLLLAICNKVVADDQLTISDFSMYPGDTKEVSVVLTNTDTYVGFQFDLYLPDGLSVSSYSAEKRLPEATALSMNRQADGAYRFIYADINKSNIYLVSDISGTSGIIIKIKVSATTNASIGKVEGHFKNIKLSKRNGEGNTYQEMSFPVKILASLTVTARNYTRVYGEPNPTFEYVVEGGELIGTPEITCIATPATPIGTYDISISQGSVTNDVVEYVNQDAFPEEGESGKIYVALDTNLTFRWSGSQYIQIGGQDLSNYPTLNGTNVYTGNNTFNLLIKACQGINFGGKYLDWSIASSSANTCLASSSVKSNTCIKCSILSIFIYPLFGEGVKPPHPWP